MLFQRRFLDGIRNGTITVAYRRWRRPSVRAGGTLLTPAGELAIASVSQVALDQISEADARRAGHESLGALLTDLGRRAQGRVYRIQFGPLRPDPRVALRESSMLTDDERRAIADRLARLDARAPGGAWTLHTLELIQSSPAVRAGDLCHLAGLEKEPFKLNVRKLKNLGLTESLGTGYRLSPRGRTFMAARKS